MTWLGHNSEPRTKCGKTRVPSNSHNVSNMMLTLRFLNCGAGRSQHRVIMKIKYNNVWESVLQMMRCYTSVNC